MAASQVLPDDFLQSTDESIHNLNHIQIKCVHSGSKSYSSCSCWYNGKDQKPKTKKQKKRKGTS